MTKINIDLVKVAKIGSLVLQGAAMVVGAYATSKSNEKHMQEFVEKHFEQMSSK